MDERCNTIQCFAAVRKHVQGERASQSVDINTFSSTSEGAEKKARERNEMCRVTPGMNKNYPEEWPVVRIGYFSIRELK